MAAASPPAQQSFAALRLPGSRPYLIGNGLVMMADSIEHVISYWIIFQTFRSPALGGFAVIAHWLPYLLFSVYSGALADRFDSRRIIQIGMVLFMAASLGWAVLFWLDILEQWHAVVLLVIHGLAGVFWSPAAHLLVQDIVGTAHLQSAIRLLATSRTLGLLLGPAIGGAMMIVLSPVAGLLINALIYLPLTLWLVGAPYGPRFRAAPATPHAPIGGLSDIVSTIRSVSGNATIVSMLLLAAAASLLVGNAYQAQMPAFADMLSADRSGFDYSVLLTAHAAGAVVAGLVLEGRNMLPARPRSAFVLCVLWCLALGGFAVTENYWLAAVLLFAAGFLLLALNSMTQTLVQVHAPAEIRGRVVGLYHTVALGLMTFSGVTIGLGGDVLGVRWSVGISSLLLACATLALFAWRRGARPMHQA